MRQILSVLICAAGIASCTSAIAAEEEAFTAEQVGRIVTALDPRAAPHGQGWRMQVGGRIALVSVDTDLGRLRVMVPVRGEHGLGAADLKRMMQANFDSALDARYAVARGLVWAVFAHPLRRLDKTQLITGLAQAVTLARTHGTLYSSGALHFGGGDSDTPQRGLLEDLLRRGEAL